MNHLAAKVWPHGVWDVLFLTNVNQSVGSHNSQPVDTLEVQDNIPFFSLALNEPKISCLKFHKLFLPLSHYLYMPPPQLPAFLLLPFSSWPMMGIPASPCLFKNEAWLSKPCRSSHTKVKPTSSGKSTLMIPRPITLFHSLLVREDGLHLVSDLDLDSIRPWEGCQPACLHFLICKIKIFSLTLWLCCKH